MIDSILLFAQTVSPLGVIALLVIVIFMMVKNTGKVEQLFSGQTSDTKAVRDKAVNDAFDWSMLNSKLDEIKYNHLHGLPEMADGLKRIEAKVDSIADKQEKQGNRITVLETLNKK